MADAPAVTITNQSVILSAPCPHCDAATVQIKGGSGTEHGACLQCIADGGSCCSLLPLSRWER